MKKTILPFLLISLVMSIHAQHRPFASIKMDEGKYMDETEVDMASWLSYYSWVLNHEGSKFAQKILPDSNAIEPRLWAYINASTNDQILVFGRYSFQPIGNFGKTCKECEKYGARLSTEKNYCAMLNFPVTGITYEQAIDFCKWRTIVDGNGELIFRLPTPEEWRQFALSGLTNKEQLNGIPDTLTKKGCPQFNYSTVCNCEYDKFQGELNGIGQYNPMENKAFDVFGNVSEMTSEKEVAKGGNFTLRANQCHIDSIQSYSSPQIWLGFRCIAVKDAGKNKHEAYLTNTDSRNNNLFVDPRNGKNYRTIKIANQIWMAENLAYKPDSGKYWAYDNDISSVTKSGYLYNWKTAKQVCPSGWHLPSKDEFTILLNQYGGEGTSAYKQLIPKGNSGFMMLESGLRYGSNFVPVIDGTVFWTSTLFKKHKCWAVVMDRSNQNIYLYSSFNSNFGLQVRCIKDE
jgi:uncharacterized protein (TIGR02145 family)